MNPPQIVIMGAGLAWLFITALSEDWHYPRLNLVRKKAVFRISIVTSVVLCTAWFTYVAHTKHGRSQDVKAQNTPDSEPNVTIQLPSVGNLKKRAIGLADEITEDLYQHGWPQRYPRQWKETIGHPLLERIPTDPEKNLDWRRRRSESFRFRFYNRALDLKNEFSQLHLRDQQLDAFFRHGQDDGVPLIPFEIENVAERLEILANQLPDQP